MCHVHWWDEESENTGVRRGEEVTRKLHRCEMNAGKDATNDWENEEDLAEEGDVGFVSFSTFDAAVTCINSLSNHELVTPKSDADIVALVGESLVLDKYALATAVRSRASLVPIDTGQQVHACIVN
ncbi:hypothetical protein SUGI_0368900 [Cryptomeria japonica]|nr:hypothetical protein SUGI_0368900 [Cryptomeria japonica]